MFMKDYHSHTVFFSNINIWTVQGVRVEEPKPAQQLPSKVYTNQDLESFRTNFAHTQVTINLFFSVGVTIDE